MRYPQQSSGLLANLVNYLIFISFLIVIGKFGQAHPPCCMTCKHAPPLSSKDKEFTPSPG